MNQASNRAWANISCVGEVEEVVYLCLLAPRAGLWSFSFTCCQHIHNPKLLSTLRGITGWCRTVVCLLDFICFVQPSWSSECTPSTCFGVHVGCESEEGMSSVCRVLPPFRRYLHLFKFTYLGPLRLVNNQESSYNVYQGVSLHIHTLICRWLTKIY